jgi:hypothetical protein
MASAAVSDAGNRYARTPGGIAIGLGITKGAASQAVKAWRARADHAPARSAGRARPALDLTNGGRRMADRDPLLKIAAARAHLSPACCNRDAGGGARALAPEAGGAATGTCADCRLRPDEARGETGGPRRCGRTRKRSTERTAALHDLRGARNARRAVEVAALGIGTVRRRGEPGPSCRRSAHRHRAFVGEASSTPAIPISPRRAVARHAVGGLTASGAIRCATAHEGAPDSLSSPGLASSSSAVRHCSARRAPCAPIGIAEMDRIRMARLDIPPGTKRHRFDRRRARRGPSRVSSVAGST